MKDKSEIQTGQNGRLLGFRHRVKVKIVDGSPTEPLPSQVVILNHDGTVQKYELLNEQGELDFGNGVMAVKFCTINPTEDISAFLPWQVKWRASKDEDILMARHESQCKWHNKRVKKGETPIRELVEVVSEVPTQFVGLQHGDRMAMCLGGSGDYFAFAVAHRLHSSGGELYRLPAFKLQTHRGEGVSKDDDAELLAKLLQTHPQDFYPTVIRDLDIIRVRETFKRRMDAMKDRMAATQRLRQRLIGMTFCTTEGGFPQGDLEKRFAALKTSDSIYTAIVKAEERELKAMTEAVEATDIYQRLFADIPGVGPAIAAGLMSCVIDIRRFEAAPKLKKFLGVHVLPDGTFPRRRNGVVANWSQDGRLRLYLLADQFVKKPKSEWGMKLNAYKAKLRLKHPYICIEVKTGEVDTVTGKAKVELVPLIPGKHKVVSKSGRKYQILGDDGKVVREITGPMRYNDGHIHKMAIWRTLTKFVEWLHREWWKIEDAHKVSEIPTTTEPDTGEGGESQKAA